MTPPPDVGFVTERPHDVGTSIRRTPVGWWTATGGTLSGNTFDGAGMSGADYADSWVDVKGNSWAVSACDNTAATARSGLSNLTCR
jgi:hypothetical protein